jgi:hypothetical protein
MSGGNSRQHGTPGSREKYTHFGEAGKCQEGTPDSTITHLKNVGRELPTARKSTKGINENYEITLWILMILLKLVHQSIAKIVESIANTFGWLAVIEYALTQIKS